MKEVKISTFILVILCFAWTINAYSQITDVHFNRARELLNTWRYSDAAEEFKEIIKLAPAGSKVEQNAKYWVGQCYFRAGQFDKALSTFENLIEEYPKSAIIPVTQLMLGKVQLAKDNKKSQRTINDALEKGVIIDPNTGVKYSKTVAFAGKNDVIEDINDPTRHINVRLSPNGKFLLYGKIVVPLDGNDPFDLVDIPAECFTWSPDGKNVAFYSGEAICMVPVSQETGRTTGPVRNLLDYHDEWEPRVNWSPDGEKLVFRKEDDIWTLSVKDGSLTQITNDPAKEFYPRWSPDGKTIMYVMWKDLLSFWLISAEGGVPRKIIEPVGMCLPFWSPDGKWILYALDEKIHLFNLNDKREREMIPPWEIVGGFFSWSPDGRKMLFFQPSYDYKYGLKVVSAFGGPPFDPVMHLNLYAWSLDWSDDNKIITKGENEEGNVVFWIFPLSGGDPVLLELDVSVDGNPFPFDVSPNVKKLAFMVNRDDGTEDLFVVPISLQDARTTGPAIKIFDRWFAAPGHPASWSPDGNKFAVIHRGDLWIASSNGDKPVQITKTPELEHGRLDWSPDGKMVHYIVRHSQEVRTSYVVSVSDGETTKILDTGPGRIHTWSPDSKELAVVLNGSISIMPVNGGGTQQIAKLKDLGLDKVFTLRWSPDGKSIACLGNHIEKGPGGPIFVIPVKGGKTTTLGTDDPSHKYSLFWSPDGRWIAYNSEGSVKVRPEGTMWEADFEDVLTNLID